MDNNNYNYEQQNNQYNTYPTGKQDPVEFGDWMLTLFLTMIPVVNIIMLIVWLASSETAPSKRNWAKAQLVWVIIGVVASLLLSVMFAGFFAAAFGGLY